MSAQEFSVGKNMAAHDGVDGHPLGEWVYVLETTNGSVWGPWFTRADAAAAKATGLDGFLASGWITVHAVPVGSLRLRDIRTPPTATRNMTGRTGTIERKVDGDDAVERAYRQSVDNLHATHKARGYI